MKCPDCRGTHIRNNGHRQRSIVVMDGIPNGTDVIFQFFRKRQGFSDQA